MAENRTNDTLNFKSQVIYYWNYFNLQLQMILYDHNADRIKYYLLQKYH